MNHYTYYDLDLWREGIPSNFFLIIEFIRIRPTFFEKTDYMCFSLHLEKLEKIATILGIDKLILPPTHQIEYPLELYDHL